MNVSHDYKFIWWASPRCASRETAGVMGLFNFWIYYPDAPCHVGNRFGELEDNPIKYEGNPFTHFASIPPEINPDEYKLIINIRNPYSWVVSCWHAEFNDLRSNPDAEFCSFEQFVKSRTEHFWNNVEDATNEQIINLNKQPDYLVRFENLVESVLAIPFIKEKENHPKIQRWIQTAEGRKEKNGWREGYREEVKNINWKVWYNQELADIVYNTKENYFKTFSYDKDSWK